MKIVHVILISLGFLTSLALAKNGCTVYTNPIPKTLEAYPDRIAVYGKIIKVEAQYSEFEIMEVIHGDVAPNSVIKIWDEKDFECNGTWDLGSGKIGAVGDSAIIIVPEITEVKNGWDVIGDYRMPHFYAYRSIFQIADGAALYGDEAKGIELKKYPVPEFMEIVGSYFTPLSIRRNQKPASKSIRYGLFRLGKYDLNGKYLDR